MIPFLIIAAWIAVPLVTAGVTHFLEARLAINSFLERSNKS